MLSFFPALVEQELKADSEAGAGRFLFSAEAGPSSYFLGSISPGLYSFNNNKNAA